jgi:restriction endonuclease
VLGSEFTAATRVRAVAVPAISGATVTKLNLVQLAQVVKLDKAEVSRVVDAVVDVVTSACASGGNVNVALRPVVEVDITDAGVSADRQIATRVRDAEQVQVLPDILAYLQKESELTRHTLAEILKASGRLAEFKINPQPND